MPLEPQPIFPLEDLTERNAEMLELMLANKMALDREHMASEMGALMYRVAHPAIVDTSSRTFDPPYVDAISHGITMFEAISGYVVSSVGQDVDPIVVNFNAKVLMDASNDAQLQMKANESAEVFRDDMPRTTEVIIAGTKRFYGSLTNYALLGAAMERQFQLDTMSKEFDILPRIM